MNKHSLAELTVIFSVKIDSPDRLENLGYNLAYFETFFTDYEIIVVEQGPEKKVQELVEGRPQVQYYFIPSAGCHYKTRNLNFATQLAGRPIVMMSDVDVICQPLCILEAVAEIKGGAAFVSPHNGLLVEVKKDFFKEKKPESLVGELLYFPKSYNLRMHDFDFTWMQPLYGESYYDSTGGCILYRKKDFFLIGGWNTNFVSYGFEDMEFVYRLGKLGYALQKMDPYNIYHLEHARHQDSYYNNSFYRSNEQEWLRVRAMTSPDLLAYALNGFRKVVFSHAAELVIHNTPEQFAVQLLPPGKTDLDALSVVIPLHISQPPYLAYLEELLDYFEKHFTNFEIIMVEGEYRHCKYMVNKTNTKYFWLGLKKFDLHEAIRKGVAESTGDVVAIWDLFSRVEPRTLRDKVTLLRRGGSVEACAIEATDWQDGRPANSRRNGVGRLPARKAARNAYLKTSGEAGGVSGVTLAAKETILQSIQYGGISFGWFARPGVGVSQQKS